MENVKTEVVENIKEAQKILIGIGNEWALRDDEKDIDVYKRQSLHSPQWMMHAAQAIQKIRPSKTSKTYTYHLCNGT